ncbi:anti-sigma factor family protein [Archangium lansingense]|uniref:anti-sigma factor family protein n=1 Tax=Archangium lansingense TaxID=2995310 RepID=UPI003B82B0E7
MSSATPCDSTRLVDAHFGRRGLPPRRERALREHLPGCATCRARYERHLLLAEVDRSIPDARERLARGLGLAAAPRTRTWPVQLGLAFALGLCALVLVPRLGASPTVDEGFTPRGGTEAHGPVVGPPPALEVYRVRDGKAEPTNGSMRADDELAFAYRNPDGLPFLMVFATDMAGQVYWYYPSWTDPDTSPTSVLTQQSEHPLELPDAIRHPLPPGKFSLHALFTRAPLSVHEVEARLARREPLVGEGEHMTHLPLLVQP